MSVDPDSREGGEGSGYITRFLTNWDPQLGVFENLRAYSGQPRVRVGAWVVATIGGIITVIQLAVVETIRDTAAGLGDLVDAVFGYFGTILRVTSGEGAELPSGRWAPGSLPLTEQSFVNAATSLDGLPAFIVALVVTLVVAYIVSLFVQGVRRLG